jgi:hypothetical protein
MFEEEIGGFEKSRSLSASALLLQPLAQIVQHLKLGYEHI